MRIFIVAIMLVNFLSAQVDTTFLGLRGYEDLDGNTQLFYRIQSSYSIERIPDEYQGERRKDIFHADIVKNSDSLFIHDYINFYTPFPATGHSVSDFEFVDKTLTDFYQCGDGVSSFEPSPLVVFNRDYENYLGVNSFHGTTFNMEIIDKDSSTNVYVYTNNSPNGIFKNDDYSYELIPSTEGLKLISINPGSPNIWFVEDENDYLYKSVDTGDTFYVVDSLVNNDYNNHFNEVADYINRYFIFDSDNQHVYRSHYNRNKYHLSVSNNSGELDSWTTIYESDKIINFSIDSLNTGLIYFATSNQIYKSKNYGDTYNLVLELDENISGIYKKPNSDILYITTSHKLLEINSDSIKVLKQLINYEALSYYPLHIGAKWIYRVERIDYEENYYSTSSDYTLIKTVKSDTILNNYKKYFVIEEVIDDSISSNYYLRIDTMSNIIYCYDETENNKEYIYENLGIDEKDSFTSIEFYTDKKLETEVYFSKIGLEYLFGEQISYKTNFYKENGSLAKEYELSQGLGLTSYFQGILDGFDETVNLDAALINGTYYGDSTLVNISEYPKKIHANFSLSQNYPNPFNPTTTIKYTIPHHGGQANVASGFSLSNVNLTVYDILGQKIAVLVNQQQTPGNYQTVFDASNLPSGIYYYSLSVNNYLSTKKMILLK